MTLLRCPFCGSSGRMVKRQSITRDDDVIAYVECTNDVSCGAEGPSTMEASDRDAVAKAERGWNRRTPSMPPADELCFKDPRNPRPASECADCRQRKP